jgi:hypothetical protein
MISCIGADTCTTINFKSLLCRKQNIFSAKELTFAMHAEPVKYVKVNGKLMTHVKTKSNRLCLLLTNQFITIIN